MQLICPPGGDPEKKSIVVAQEHLRGLVLWGFVKYIIPPTVILILSITSGFERFVLFLFKSRLCPLKSSVHWLGGPFRELLNSHRT